MGKVYCRGCSTYLGNIEGSIHKDIVYLCKSCNTQREALELMYKDKPKDKSFNDIFDTFGGIFKDKL